MTVKQEKFLYAKIKDYEKRLGRLEKLLNVQGCEKVEPQAVCPDPSYDGMDRQTGA